MCARGVRGVCAVCARGVCAPVRNGSDRQNSNPRRNLIESVPWCVAKEILYTGS